MQLHEFDLQLAIPRFPWEGYPNNQSNPTSEGVLFGVYVLLDTPAAAEVQILLQLTQQGLSAREIWTARDGSSLFLDLDQLKVTSAYARHVSAAVGRRVGVSIKPSWLSWTLRIYQNDDA